MKILLYGYGNPGRQDDGLGIAFVEQMEQWVIDNDLKGYSFENNYQLNIEDAEEVSDKDLVIFADASQEDIEDFCVSKVDKSSKATFTTHAASPGYIMHLCKELFKKTPFTLLVHLKGYEWEFQEGLSEKAQKNLDDALAYFKELMLEPGEIVGGGRIKEC